MATEHESLFPFGQWPDVWHALEAIQAYDLESTDSGVRDEVLRQRCVQEIEAMTPRDFNTGISRFCRDAYFSDDALASGYGAEDSASFFRWVFDGDFRHG